MKSITETAKSLGEAFNFKSHKNGYAVSVALALLIAIILFSIYYYTTARSVQEEYMSMYVLDAQKQAINYPELVVNGANSTFTVYIDVVNHMKHDQNCTVQVKVTRNTNPSIPLYNVTPTNTYNTISPLGDGNTWEIPAKITLNQFGTNKVVFELWTANENGDLQFSQNYCVLNVQVIEEVIH